MSKPLHSLERLGEEFERVARRNGRPVRVRRRSLVIGAIAASSISAAALAATGILTGEPVKDPPWYPTPTPHAGAGVVRGTSVTLTDLRVPDPAGGPTWGLRTMTTTRNSGCVQVGRVVDGRLGVLGQDGAGRNDGRFHELPPDVQVGRDCNLLDNAGRLFIAMSVQGLPASGSALGCIVSRPSRAGLAHMNQAERRRFARIPTCPPEDMRILYFGTLGPAATSVSYDDHGVRRTARTVGPWGAYLVVLRPDRAHPARGYYVPASSPGSGLATITYRDGHRCNIRSPRALGGARTCPLVGYVSPPTSTLTTEQVATRVHARLSAKPSAIPGLGDHNGPKAWIVTVSFRARVAAGPRSAYVVTQRLSPGASCPQSRGMAIQPIARDVRVGDLVRTRFYVTAKCRGAVSGDVRFQPAPATLLPAPGPVLGDARRSPVVGKYTVALPDP